MRARRWSTILVVVVVVVAAGFILFKKRNVAPIVGDLAPNFSLTSMQGQTIQLSQLQGKPVFVNFFASWCPPCKYETPDVVKMYKKYGNKIAFIGVDLTVSDSISGVSQFMKKYGVTYPVLLDKKGNAMKTYKIMAIPTSFFIKPNGQIIARYLGAMKPKVMQQEFQKLLASQ